MTYFILQTLFWLLLAFIVGLLLGRWLKALLCKQNETNYSLEGGHAGYAEKTSGSAERTSTYTGTADKLAFRDTSEFDASSTTTSSDSSVSFKAAASAAVAGAAAYSLSDDERNAEIDAEIKEDSSTSSRKTDLDDPIEIDLDIAARTDDSVESTVDMESITDSAMGTTIGTTIDDVSVTVGEDDDELTSEDISTGSIESSAEENTENSIESSSDFDKAMSQAEQTEIDGIWEDEGLDVTSGDGSQSMSSAGLGAAVAASAAVAMNTDDSNLAAGDLDSNEQGQDQDNDNDTLFTRLEISNLRVIEGIGPVMERVLHEHGVHNWTDLSTKSDADLRSILDNYEDKYKGVEIEGWVEQAKLAASGKVEELIALQKQDGGDEISQVEVWLDKLRVKS